MTTQGSLLDADAEQALWQAWSREGEQEARRRLFDHYLPFADVMAGKLFAKRQVDTLEFDDYRHFAIIGLLEAIDRYDDAHDAGFRTFAAYRITGAVLNGVAMTSEMQQQIGTRTRLQRERLESVQEKQSDLFTQLVDVAIGLAIGFILEDSGMYRDEEGQYVENFYDRHELRQLRRWFDQNIDNLPQRERRIVRYHYYHGMSFEQIAGILGLSKGRISQLHMQAMKSLRQARSAMTTLDFRS